ncbi:MAG TPA: serine hydrolase [Candidatus Saccharimonadia bacterium]|nr:serine hydrolase [Candidatus Saccharimonadia bacterium]
MTRSNKFAVGAFVIALVAFGAGFVTARATVPATAQAHANSLAAKYPLLARSILADNSTDILINFVNLRMQLNAAFNQLPAGTQQSFYFEYLPDGTSIRIGEDNDLVAASLIKVPLVMNLYRAAELGKVNLDKTVTVTPSEVDSAFGDLYKKGAGYKLTLRQAAQYALEQSDNTATHVIYDHVGNLLSVNDQSLAGLDVDQNFKDGQAIINARSYASVLKGLYYASYLTNADSEQILVYLSHSADTNRLTADIPKNVIVAHKLGVNNATWAQSDCGIVYVPRRPYLICAMVGLRQDQANTFIAGISKDVYDYVTSQ